MARTIAAIQQEIINNIAADAELGTRLTSTSKTAVWRLLTYVVAVSIWTLEKLFDAHKTEVNDIFAQKRKGSLNWYADMARAFQIGYQLPADADTYATIDADAQIVAQASVSESAGRLKMKVAKLSGDSLAPLSPQELTSFTEYIRLVKYAGVLVDIISTVGDDMRLVLSIIYDPLVLDGDGHLIADPEREPVKETVRGFIQSLKFDGEFSPTALVDALQATEGVYIPEVRSCETKYAQNDWSVVDGYVIPNAGYLTIADENLTINYRPNVRD